MVEYSGGCECVRMLLSATALARTRLPRSTWQSQPGLRLNSLLEPTHEPVFAARPVHVVGVRNDWPQPVEVPKGLRPQQASSRLVWGGGCVSGLRRFLSRDLFRYLIRTFFRNLDGFCLRDIFLPFLLPVDFHYVLPAIGGAPSESRKY